MNFQLGQEAVDQIKEVVRRVLYDDIGVVGEQSPPPIITRSAVVFKTIGTITARSGVTAGSGTAKVNYLSTAGALTTLSGSNQTIRNFTTGTISGYGLGIQDECGTIYAAPAVATPSTAAAGATPVYARCDTALVPGSNTTGQNFTQMMWGGSSWAATTTTLNVRDPGYSACYFPNEEGWFFSPNGANYFPLGEGGLTRIVKLTTTVGINASVQGTFVNPVASVSTDSSSVPALTSVTDTIWNSYPGFNRKQVAGYMDYGFVHFSKKSKKWVLVPPHVAQFATCAISTGNTLTPGQSIPSFSGFNTRDWVSPTTAVDATPGTVQNTYSAAGRAGASVHLWRSLNDDVDPWRVLAVTRTKIQPIRELDVSTATDQVRGNLVSNWVMVGSTATNWTNQIATTTCT